MSNMQIRMQVEKEEVAERKELQQTNLMRNPNLQYDRNTEPEVIEAKKKEYMKETKDSFQNLIAQIRSKNKEKTTPENETRAGKDIPEPESQSKSKDNKKNLDISEVKDKRTSIAINNDGDLDVLSQRTENVELEQESESILKNNEHDFGNSSQMLDDQSVFDTDVDDKSEVQKTTSISSSESLDLFNDTPDKKKHKNVEKDERNRASEQKSSPISSLYITPKRKSVPGCANEGSLSRKRLRQTGIETAFSECDKARERYRKTDCPVCHQSVPASHINSHLDRCLNTSGVEKRKRKTDEAIDSEDFKENEVLDKPGRNKTIGTRLKNSKKDQQVVNDENPSVMHIDDEEVMVIDVNPDSVHMTQSQEKQEPQKRVNTRKGKKLANRKTDAKNSKKLTEVQKR